MLGGTLILMNISFFVLLWGLSVKSVQINGKIGP